MLYLKAQLARAGANGRVFGVSIELRPIGFVRTDARELPRHWSVSDVDGTLVIDEEYSQGHRGIEAGQRIVVIFHFHWSPHFSAGLLRQTSGQTGSETGVFDTCSPVRPNPIGMSVLEVLGVRGASIDAKRLDMLDGTPVLDIKPHVEITHESRRPCDGARVAADARPDGVRDCGRRFRGGLFSRPTAGRCKCSNRAATRANFPKAREKHRTEKMCVCSDFATSGKAQQRVAPPLHGGGQGFESPRLHSQNVVFCSINAGKANGLQLRLAPSDSDVPRLLRKGGCHGSRRLIAHSR